MMTPKINKLKAKIASARTIKEVDKIAKDNGKFVRELLNDDGDMRTMGIQIINLAEYQRNLIAYRNI